MSILSRLIDSDNIVKKIVSMIKTSENQEIVEDLLSKLTQRQKNQLKNEINAEAFNLIGRIGTEKELNALRPYMSNKDISRLKSYYKNEIMKDTGYHSTIAPADFQKFDVSAYGSAWGGGNIGASFESPSILASQEFIDNDIKSARVLPLKVNRSGFFDYENPKDIEKLAQELTENPKYQNFWREMTDTFKYKKQKERDIQKKLTVGKDPIEEFQKRVEQGDFTYIEKPHVLDALKKLGYPGFHVQEMGAKNAGHFYPGSTMRSRFAEFDPFKKDTGGISAGLAAALGIGGASSLMSNDAQASSLSDKEEYEEYLRLKRAKQEEMQYLKSLQERMNPKQYSDPDLPLGASRKIVEESEDKSITPKELAAIVGQSATYGFGDELLAAGQAAKEVMSGDERLQDIYDIYRARQKENEADYKKIEETHPKTAMAADLAAGFLIPGLSLAKGAKLAANAGALKKMATAAKHAAKEGAVIGGLFGAGSSEGDIENLEELLTDTATGSALGTTLGGTLAGTGSALSSGKKAVSKYVDKKLPSFDDIYDVLGGIREVSERY